jgi:hypothetical protein
MQSQRTLAIVLLIPFAVLSLYALAEVGYFGIIDYHRHSPAGWQVFADLVIACVLLLSWLIPDAKAVGRNPWPYVVLTLVAGSFGPLFYLALRTEHSAAEPLAQG